jgi:hypothetical protein
MQIDVFELLSEIRQRIGSHVAAIEAQRDFWLAEANLRAAVIGGGAAPGEATERTGAPAASGAREH